MFALSLSFEGIDLLHRGAGGWRIVGEVPLHTLDLTEELAALRKTAGVLEPDGVRTKVIIPNDQIKYLTIQTEGLSDDDRTAQVRAALDGAHCAVADALFTLRFPRRYLSLCAGTKRQ